MWTISKNSIGKIGCTKSWRPLSTTQTRRSPKPYKSIPGPSFVKFFKESLSGGKYYDKSAIQLEKELMNDYGPIIKVPGILNIDEAIMLTDPNDFELTFRTEGNYPHRTLLKVFEYYFTEVCPKRYHFGGGLVTKHGEDWYRLRSITNPILLKPATVALYTTQSDKISMDFVDRIREVRDQNNETPANFLTEIHKWAAESTANVVFDTRLNLFKNDQVATHKRALQFVSAVDKSLELSGQLEFNLSPWKYFATPTYKEFEKTLDSIMEVSNTYIDAAYEKTKKNPLTMPDGLLNKLLKIDKNIAVPVCTEFLFVGIGSTALNFTNFLYILAKHPDKQEKLRKEIQSLSMDDKGHLKSDFSAQTPYLRACFKESMRLVPGAVGISRTAGQDIEIKGYHVPKGTTLIMLPLSHYDEKVFKRPSEYIPERWLREGTPDARPDLSATHPFVYLPFGFGARSCIGKRIAEMEIFALTTRLLQNFHIEYNYGPLVYNKSALPMPISDLKFKMIDL